MGIASTLGSLLKNVSWMKIATAAMEHAPELYRKARERFQRSEEHSDAPQESELVARLERLEKLLLEQDEVIRQQSERNLLLENRCSALEARLFSFKIVSGILFFTSMILLALLMK